MRWTVPYLPSSPPSCEGHLYLREALGFLPAAQQSGGHALRPFLRAGQAADLAERHAPYFRQSIRPAGHHALPS